MPLVPGICTQCGATLSADTSKDRMLCPYCGTPFIVEKAINKTVSSAANTVGRELGKQIARGILGNFLRK